MAEGPDVVCKPDSSTLSFHSMSEEGESLNIPNRSYDPVLASSAQDIVDMDISPDYMSDFVHFSDSLQAHLD